MLKYKFINDELMELPFDYNENKHSAAFLLKLKLYFLIKDFK